MPDSLLAAAKTIARHAGVAPYDALKMFRFLQDGDLFPKSVGRKVWPAVPSMSARFLIHLACRAQPGAAEPLCMARVGVSRTGFSDLVHGLAPFLGSVANAEQLDRVELKPAEASALVFLKELEVRHYRPAPDHPAPMTDAAHIRPNFVLPGALFVAIAKTVQFDHAPGPMARLVDEPDAA